MEATPERELGRRHENSRESAYVMGRSDAETIRLQKQAELYDPSTRHLFERAGLRPGMKVLDLGSGAGDVAMIAADIVGPSGRVIGIDGNAAILETARQRAQTAGLDQLHFIAGDLHTIALDDDFDAIVGRLVLIYLPDAAAVLARLARHLRAGGIVAMQEIDLAHSVPASPIMADIYGWLGSVFDRAGFDVRLGTGLRQVFSSADLPPPHMHLDAPVGGGPDFAGFDYLENSVRSALPQIVTLGVATEDEIGVDTLGQRVRDELGDNGVLALPAMIGAWSQKP